MTPVCGANLHRILARLQTTRDNGGKCARCGQVLIPQAKEPPEDPGDHDERDPWLDAGDPGEQ